MPLLEAEDLDKLASHQRLPDISAQDEYGDQEDAYAELEANVPIRTEHKEIEVSEGASQTTIALVGWVLGTIANSPEIDDRFVIGTTTLTVTKAEPLTDFDGVVDHYQLDLEEIYVG